MQVSQGAPPARREMQVRASCETANVGACRCFFQGRRRARPERSRPRLTRAPTSSVCVVAFHVSWEAHISRDRLGCASREISGHNHCTSFSSEVIVTGLLGAAANTWGLGGSKCCHGCRSGSQSGHNHCTSFSSGVIVTAWEDASDAFGPPSVGMKYYRHRIQTTTRDGRCARPVRTRGIA